MTIRQISLVFLVSPATDFVGWAEIGGDVVVGEEVINFFMNLCGGLVCVVDKTAAVADFGVEHLAGGECLVGLDEINDVIRHLVVGTPGDV